MIEGLGVATPIGVSGPVVGATNSARRPPVVEYRLLTGENMAPVIVNYPVVAAPSQSDFAFVYTRGADCPDSELVCPDIPASPERVGVTFSEDPFSRSMVSPTPSVYLVVRVEQSVAATLGARMGLDSRQVLSESPNHTAVLPDNLSLLPPRTVHSVYCPDPSGGSDNAVGFAGQLVGVLRGPGVPEYQLAIDSSRFQAATRLGFVTRRLPPGTPFIVSGLAWQSYVNPVGTHRQVVHKP
jgi:hypothetical protein